MQINEIKELKTRLEDDILNLINEFHKVSPIAAKEIKLKVQTLYSEGDYIPIPRITDVKVTLAWEGV